MSKKKIAQNTFFLYLLTFSNYFIGLLLYPFLSRTLSIEAFGLISFSMAYVLIFQVVVEFGFMISATALISKYRQNIHKINQIISDTLTAKIILSGISILLFLSSTFFLDKVRANFYIVLLFLISSLLTAFLPDFYYRGIEQMRSISLRTLVARLLSLIIIFFVVKSDRDAVLVPLAFIVSGVVSLVIAFLTMRKMGVRLKISSLKRGLKSLKDSSAFFLSRLAVSINQSMGAYFLGIKYDPASYQMGVFSGAARLSSASEMFLSPVVDSLYPHMVHKKDYKIFKKILYLGMAVWLAVCVLIFIKADEIILIILGNNFKNSGDYLRILTFGSFMAFPNMMFGYNALSPIGKAFQANMSIVLSAIVNISILSLLSVFNAINVVVVCWVVACSNLLMLCYRLTIFLIAKKTQPV